MTFLKNLPWVLGDRFFLFFVLMALLAVISGGLFFLKYVVLMNVGKGEEAFGLPRLEKQVLQGILKEYETRRENLEQTNSKIYPNPFSPKSE